MGHHSRSVEDLVISCHQGFNASNTIIIDAEARKVRGCKKNAIVVREYVAEDVAKDMKEEKYPGRVGRLSRRYGLC